MFNRISGNCSQKCELVQETDQWPGVPITVVNVSVEFPLLFSQQEAKQE
jgi:hypothetical protein